MHRTDRFVSAALALALAAGATHAQTRTWANPVNGSWFNAALWSPANIPDTAGEDAVIDAAGLYSVSIDTGSPSIGALFIDEPMATLNILGGRVLEVSNGLANDGLLVVNSNGSASDAFISFAASTTITGTGELELRGFLNDAQLVAAAGVVVTNGPTHTITGRGVISAELVNDGTIIADGPGLPLTLSGGAKTNNATMQTISSAILDITTTITQPSGVLRADTGRIRVPAGAVVSIIGGTLETPNGGSVQLLVNSDTTLTSITSTGEFTLQGGADAFVNGTGLTNDGLFVVNSNGSATDARLIFTESGTISGSGELELRGFLLDSQLVSDPGVVVTNSATHTITGRGVISAELVNDGTIIADGPGLPMTLNGPAKTNNAIMRTTGNAILDIVDTTITQPSGLIQADTGQIRVPAGAVVSIIGGTLETLNGGSVQLLVNSDTTLTSVTSTGDFNMQGGADVFVNGTGLTNEGLFVVSSNGSASDARLIFTESGTIDGQGTLELRGFIFDSQLVSDPGVVVTHAAGHTITGRGVISADLVNNGTITADVSGNQLTITGATKTNNATMRSVGNGLLFLVDVDIVQSASGQIIAEGGRVEFFTGSETTIAGGTLGSSGTGQVVARLSSITGLDGVTLSGTPAVNGGATLLVLDGGVINGTTLVLNDNGSSSDAILRFAAAATIGGAGTIELRGLALDATLETADGIVGTVGPDQTITGQGLMRGDLALQGTLSPGIGGAGAISTGPGAIAFGPTHTYACQIIGTSIAQYDRLAGSASVAVDGVVEVTLPGAFVPAKGNSFEIITASGGVSGRFDAIIAPPPTPPLVWKAAYQPDKVTLHVTCRADVTTTGTSNGVPDGAVDISDYSQYLTLWSAGDSEADFTTTGTSNGMPDGTVDISDFSFYLTLWAAGCP